MALADSDDAALEAFRAGLKRRDVFVPAGVRYADPRQGLLSGEAWNAARLTVCCSLDRSPDAGAEMSDLTARLDLAWRQVAANLPDNPAARIERRNGRDKLVLSPLDKPERPPSLIALQSAVAARMPKIDLPDVMLEVAARSGFAKTFTHVSERHARVEDFTTSLCGGLIAQACNIGFEPLIRTDQPALNRARLSWVSQNFIRPETIATANARVVAAQNALPIAHIWGNGEGASADGIRFVAPSSAIHAGSNPKYFGAGRGITYYNLVPDQFTGLNAVVVPDTLRDSLLILGLLLDQETDLEPAEVMTDTAAYADTVFGLFWLLGYQFSPRLADIGDVRFWPINRPQRRGNPTLRRTGRFLWGGKMPCSPARPPAVNAGPCWLRAPTQSSRAFRSMPDADSDPRRTGIPIDRPGDPDHRRPAQVFPDRRVSHPDRARDRPHARAARILQPQNFSHLPHR